MNIIIKNNTLFSFAVVFENNRYQLDSRKTTALFAYGEKANILFEIQEKDSVSISILDVLLGLFLGDSTITKIYCDYEIEVKKLIDETVIIVLEENRWCPREQAYFASCCAISENSEITDKQYPVRNLEKTKKKHKRLHLYVSSLLPIGLILFICIFIFSPPNLAISFFLFWVLFFGYPSMKEIKRFKKLSDLNLINEKMLEHSKYRKEHGTDFYDDNSKTAKFVEKVFDKIFKSDKNK